jgi:Cu-processing system permease protein
VGLAAPLVGTFLLGLLLPFVLHTMLSAQVLARLLPLASSGVMLTVIFTAIAFLISVRQTDRVRGIAVALIAWLAFAVLYDGAVLLLVSTFYAYPIEKPLLAVMMANPIDLARISILMSFDAGALMGYTGAVFTRFFGSALGLGLTFSALLVWTALPFRSARVAFERQDF